MRQSMLVGAGGGSLSLMPLNMPNPDEQKKGILVLHQGARRRAAARASTEIRLDRRMRTVFAAVEGANGTVPSKGIYAIRAGEQHPWRVMSRRLKEARDAGATPAQLLEILEEMQRWVLDDLYSPSTSRAS